MQNMNKYNNHSLLKWIKQMLMMSEVTYQMLKIKKIVNIHLRPAPVPSASAASSNYMCVTLGAFSLRVFFGLFSYRFSVLAKSSFETEWNSLWLYLFLWSPSLFAISSTKDQKVMDIPSHLSVFHTRSQFQELEICCG